MHLCGAFYVNHLPTLLLVKSPCSVSSEAIAGSQQDTAQEWVVVRRAMAPQAGGEAVVHVMAGPPQHWPRHFNTDYC